MKSTAALVVAMMSFAGAAPAAPGAAPTVEQLEQLKAVYLACDARASQSLLGPQDASLCSTNHEHLLQQAFGGDFDRLLAWWRDQRGATAAKPAAARAR